MGEGMLGNDIEEKEREEGLRRGAVSCAMRYGAYLAAFASARFLRRRVPLTAVICVTGRCNLRCWYCYGEHPARAPEEFSTARIFSMLDDFAALGTRIVQFQGGEPFMLEDLEEICRHAGRLGMLRDIVTNGVLIRRRPDVLKYLERICISLDGPRELNDANRGQGTFDKIVAGVDIAADSGLRVRISAVLTGQTRCEDIDWLVGFCRERRACVNFSPSFDFVPRFDPGSFRPFDVNDAHLRGLFDCIKAHKKLGAPVQFSAAGFSIAKSWPFPYSQKRRARARELPEDFYYPRCFHGDYVVFVDSDGLMYPCCNLWGNRAAARSINELGVKEAFEQVGRDGCAACYIPAYIDRNLFFSLRPGVLFNYLTQSIRDLL